VKINEAFEADQPKIWIRREQFAPQSRDVLNFRGRAFSVGQLGPDFLILDSAVDPPPVDATIFLSIDGNERQWDLRLPEGISAGSRRVVIGKAA
jgi:hypothetical protein